MPTAIPSDHQLYGKAARRCILELDVNGMRKLHRQVNPHLPSPGDDNHVLATLHHARTQLKSAPFNLRAYSHHYLVRNGYPSALPDDLKPAAERIYPTTTPATGFAALFRPRILRPLKAPVEEAVTEVILDAYGTDKVHKIDHGKLKVGMLEKYDETVDKLAGKITSLLKTA